MVLDDNVRVLLFEILYQTTHSGFNQLSPHLGREQQAVLSTDVVADADDVNPRANRSASQDAVIADQAIHHLFHELGMMAAVA